MANPTSRPTTAPHAHVVQFYRDDRFLLDELGDFIGTALAAGSSAVIIATQAHRGSLAQGLKDEEINLERAIAEGRYVALDAAETLSKFMADGLPDEARFAEFIGSVIARAERAARDGNHRVVAFGEMVALLWAEGKTDAAIRTEKLWNGLAKAYAFSLRCAYPMQGFCREEHQNLLMQVCAEHTGVVPDASYSELTSEEERLRNVVRLQQRMEVLLTEVESYRKEEQFRLFVHAVPDYAIFMLDAEGQVASWNEGAQRIHGYEAAEIMGKPFSCFIVKEEAHADETEKLLDLAIRQGHAQTEAWRLRKDGSAFWAEVTVAAVRDATGKLVGFGNVTHDLTERRRAETALQRSEDRFRLMTEAVQDYAIFMLDAQGNVSTWNRGAERIKGFKAADIIGRHYSCFYPEAEIQAGKPARQLDIAAKQGRFEDEGWRLRKDGSRFWANVIITPIRDETNKLIGFAKITRDATDRMLKEKSLRDLTSHLLRMQDEERRRIGRDLHDTLGQCVTAVKISLDSLAGRLGQDESWTRQQVNQCAGLAEECVKEVRTISYLLYPPMLEEIGLKSAISWYVDGFSARSGIQVAFDASATFRRLSRDHELALFRVLQESLTNVHRHSGSPTAGVQLSRCNGLAVLKVRDDGKGLPPSILEESGALGPSSIGVGLRGMRERLEQLGGSLEISSSAHGVTVTAKVPVGQPDDAKAA